MEKLLKEKNYSLARVLCTLTRECVKGWKAKRFLACVFYLTITFRLSLPLTTI